MKKSYVDVTVRLIIRSNEDQDLNEVLEDMEVEFTDQTGGADIEDIEVRDWVVTDSK